LVEEGGEIMPFMDFLKNQGIRYTLYRQDEPRRAEVGLPCKGYVMFSPEVDVREMDILVNPIGETLHIVRTETDFAYQKPHFIKAFYQTEQEYSAVKQPSNPVFNIQNAYGSVIGTNNQATINYNSAVSELKEKVAADTSGDKEQLEKIVSLLEMVVNDQVPPSKGLFSKFREVMERNSWITGSVANALLGWLLTKTP